MKEPRMAVRLSCCAGLLAASVCAAENAMPPDTQRILSTIEQRAAKYSGADRRAAESLNRDGERAYRKGNYDAAFTAFSNSYPNFPTAYAYIMTGDSHWRAALQFARTKAASWNAGPADGQACPWSNERFTHNVLMDLDQHHEVGLALAAKANGALPVDPFLQRAQASATCLRHLGERYATLPRSGCVDLEALAECLGPPLPLAGEAR